MRNLVVVAASIAAVVVTGSAYAVCNLNSCAEQIERLVAFSNGDVNIWTTGDETLLDCTLPSNGAIVIPEDAEGREQMYSAVLSAYLAGNEIGIRIFNGSDPCTVRYVDMKS